MIEISTPQKTNFQSPKSIKIVGPYFTNYSYGKVNRGIAFGINTLQNNFKAYVFCSDDKIDYKPTDSELKNNPKLNEIVLREDKETDFALYDNFPKSFSEKHGIAELNAKIKIPFVAWEESVYPANWVEEMNESADVVFTMSKFVKDILKSSGVKVPMFVVPIAMDQIQFEDVKGEYSLNTKKKIKFLHISTAKKRKGVDVLIKAFNEEFTNKDDVVLILKTSPGPDNTSDELIKKFAKENGPEIININDSTLTEIDIAKLHNSVDAEIYPSRAEGFGLPIIEAMYRSKPVIATNYSGQTDFINSDNAILLDFKMEYSKDSEFANVGSKWAEPSIDDLKRKMRTLYENLKNPSGKATSPERAYYAVENIIGEDPLGGGVLKSISDNAHQTAKEYNWENSAKRLTSILENVGDIDSLKNKSIAVITPINSQDGIGVYTKNLYSCMERSFKNFYYIANSDVADKVVTDEENVIRTWEMNVGNFEKTLEFIKDKVDIVHIQYHSASYYPPEVLSEFIKDLKNLGKKVFVTLHAVRGNGFDHIKSVPNLNLCEKVIIHNKSDFEYAEQTLKNAVLSPLGAIEFKNRDKSKLREEFGLTKNSPIIATHGLLNKNKGVPNIIDAISILKKDYPDILFLSINAVSSNNAFATSIFEECKKKVEELDLEKNVIFIPEFLTNAQLEILVQLSDFNILAYEDAGESASDAVRKFIASLKPTVVTDIPMFNDFESEVWKIENNSPENIVNGIKNLIDDKNLQKSLTNKSKDYIEKHNFNSKALEHLNWYSQ